MNSLEVINKIEYPLFSRNIRDLKYADRQEMGNILSEVVSTLKSIDKRIQKNETDIEEIREKTIAEVANIGDSVAVIEKNLKSHGVDINEIKTEYPLLPPEADDLSAAVRRKMATCMGGKKSPAYRNLKELRKKICRDIYYEIKRQYDLIDEKGHQKSYKKLKRKYFKGALSLVDEYFLPIEYENQVNAENELGDIDD